MSNSCLQHHASVLSDFAQETSVRARNAPDDFFLQIAAKNQTEAASEAAHLLTPASD